MWPNGRANVQNWTHKEYIDVLVHERRKSSALAMELRLSCTKPSIWHLQ